MTRAAAGVPTTLPSIDTRTVIGFAVSGSRAQPVTRRSVLPGARTTCSKAPIGLKFSVIVAQAAAELPLPKLTLMPYAQTAWRPLIAGTVIAKMCRE